MKLSQSDIAVLKRAAERKGSRKGLVFESNLEKKRGFNSAKKLAKLGLIEDAKITYHQCNGRPDSLFGRLWIDGYAWSEFEGELTDEGLELAESLE